jgi:hypothetical protein
MSNMAGPSDITRLIAILQHLNALNTQLANEIATLQMNEQAMPLNIMAIEQNLVMIRMLKTMIHAILRTVPELMKD